MEWFETTVIVVHVLISLALIGLVLLQQGKGAEAGASFGSGASQTVFGSQGSTGFLTKVTAYFAVIFFVTSISLAVIAKQKAELAGDDAGSLVVPEQQAPAEDIADDSASADSETAAQQEGAVELESAAEGSETPELE